MNKVLIRSTIGLNLENTLSEWNRIQKPVIIRFYAPEMSMVGKFKETESKFMILRGWKEWDSTANAVKAENILKLDHKHNCPTLWIWQNHWIVNFKRVNFVVYELYLNKDIF